MAEDFLLCARWVLPVEPAGALEDHAIAVRSGVVEALLPAGDARRRYSDLELVELPHHTVIPGLVDAHAALPASALEDAALRACAESLAGGVTCRAYVSHPPEAALGAARAAGLRAALGLLASQSASAYASDFDDYLRKGLALRDRVREEPALSFFLAPLAAQALSDAQLRHVATLAAELDLPVQLRLGEDGALAGLERLGRLGLLAPNLAVVQGDTLAPGEIELLTRHGCSVVLCPSSGLASGRGLAPAAQQLLRAGVSLALGSGTASGGRRLDLFEEMRACALTAETALRAATLGGARALGLDGAVGSIAPGKQADLVAVDMQAPWHVPSRDALSWIVYTAGRENVSRVWVAGRLAFVGGAQNARFPLLAGGGGLS